MLGKNELSLNNLGGSKDLEGSWTLGSGPPYPCSSTFRTHSLEPSSFPPTKAFPGCLSLLLPFALACTP